MYNTYIPWTEKYKPTNFDSFKNSNLILENFENSKEKFSNCILHGEAGVGKTTFINLLTKKLYHKDDIPYCVLSLNASDERGINTVRNKIKKFSKQKNYKKYKFKIIILDEADSLTYEAQTALRRIIELYSHNTRFCFICNYDNKIINPIKSRCNIIKFNNFSNEYIKNYITDILKKEKLYDNYNKYIDIVLNLSKNDLRKSIIFIESLTKININFLNENIIYNIFGILNKNNLINILNKLKSYDNISDIASKLKCYSINDIIDNITDIVLNMDVNHNKKYNFLILLSDIDNIKNQMVNYNIIIIKILSEYLSLTH